MKNIKVGASVVSIYELTDYDGSPFHKGEVGEVVKTTRSTIHVRDSRGHIHIRYRYDFKKAQQSTSFTDALAANGFVPVPKAKLKVQTR